MSARKPQVHLVHKTYGEVVVKNAWFTSGSNDEKCFFVEKDGNKKQLLADPQYWLSAAEEVSHVWNEFAQESEANRKRMLARDHARDRRAAQINLNQSLAMEMLDS